MIDISYKVIPQFKPDFSKLVVLLSDKTEGKQTYTFKVSSDVTSIKIKNLEEFPYITIVANAITIDKN